MYRGQMHAETEVRWHDEFAKTLAELPPGEGFADQAWAPRPGTGGRATGRAGGVRAGRARLHRTVTHTTRGKGRGMRIIEAKGLTRTFRSRKRTVEAVRGVDLAVADGEIVGFLGPNGAGKTTTLRMLTTLLRPTSGTATVAGADLLADPVGVRSRISYVPQAIGATGGGSDPNAKVGEELAFQAQLYRVPARDILARVALLVQAIVLVLAGLAFGMRAPVAGVLIGFGFVAVVAVSLAAVSYTVGLLTKSEDVLAPLLNMVIVPLMLLSGIMLPMTLGPGWLQGIARATPFRYIIDAMRDAYAGHYANTIMLEGIAVAVGLAALCLWVAFRVFVRENA